VIIPENLINKKNESCSPNGVGSWLIPAKLSSAINIIEKLEKIKRKRQKKSFKISEFSKEILVNWKKIIVDGKKLRNHFAKKVWKKEDIG
jgi:hypothetical protein